MTRDSLHDKLAVILHADVVSSTALVKNDEHLAHARIREAFGRFRDFITNYHGRVLELRGDALLAEFERASDAISATLAFQADHAMRLAAIDDAIRPEIRAGISMGEVVIADGTITGAGVVLAQRVEQLAAPGGLCITSAVQETLPGRMPFELESLGEQQLKGFDDPLRVFRVALQAGAPVPPPRRRVKSAGLRGPLPWMVAAALLVLAAVVAYQFLPAPAGEGTSGPGAVDGQVSLPDKPSIAVLPFTNLSDDAQQEYFADGLTEDLITDVSRLTGLFVIARNTVFTYKDKAVDIGRVAGELGVRYILEGSVRRVGNEVRINAQLIDVSSGGHIWADRYDGSLDDVFSMQDRITQSIVAALEVTLTGREQRRLARDETDNPRAYDAFLKGWQLYRRYTPNDFAAAIPHFKLAVELDPDYGRAWAALASMYWISYQKSYAWTLVVNPNRDNWVSWLQTRSLASDYLEQAMRNPTPLAHQVESQMSLDFRQFDKALGEAERSVALDPNDPEGHLAMGWALVFAGRPGEAIASAETGMRLDPNNLGPHLAVLGLSRLSQREYDAAESALRQALRLTPENKNLLLPLAVTQEYLGNRSQASASLQQFVDFFIYYAPKIDTYLEWWPFRREADIRHFGGGLVSAGLSCEEDMIAYIDRLRQGGTLQ